MKKKIIIGLALIAWAKPLNCADPERIPEVVQKRLREINAQLTRLAEQQQEGARRGISATEQEAITQEMLPLVAEREKLEAKRSAAFVPPRRRAPRAVPAIMSKREGAAILFRLAEEMAKPTPPATFPISREEFLRFPKATRKIILGYKNDWARIRKNDVRRAEIAQNLVEKASKLTAEPAAFVPPRRRAPRAVPVVTPAMRRKAKKVLLELAGKIRRKPVTFPEIAPHISSKALPRKAQKMIERHKRNWRTIKQDPERIETIAQELEKAANKITPEPVEIAPMWRRAPRAVPVEAPTAAIREEREPAVPGWMGALTTKPLLPLAKEIPPEEVEAERERLLRRQKMREAAEERARE